MSDLPCYSILFLFLFVFVFFSDAFKLLFSFFLFSRVLRESTPRFVRPSVHLSVGHIIPLTSLPLPK